MMTRSTFAPLLVALLLPATSALAAPAAKVDVCHPAGNSGSVLTLNVSTNALGGHLGHGDWSPATFWADADADGYGDAGSPIVACLQPAGTATGADDCDDGDSAVNPGAAEVCNEIDDNCDGEIDEGGICGPEYGPWDAAADFSWENNPNGEWSYGSTYHNYGADPAGTFIPMPFSRQDANGMQYQNAWDWVQIYKNAGVTTFGNCADWCVQPGQLAMHPGNFNRNATMVVFTAPVDGTYAVEAIFTPIDAQIGTLFWSDPCDIETHVVVAGTVVFTDLLDSYTDESRYVDTLTLNAGDEVRFAVQSSGYYYNDGTGTDVFIELQ